MSLLFFLRDQSQLGVRTWSQTNSFHIQNRVFIHLTTSNFSLNLQISRFSLLKFCASSTVHVVHCSCWMGTAKQSSARVWRSDWLNKKLMVCQKKNNSIRATHFKHHDIPEFCLSTPSGNRTINHFPSTDKTIHNQLGTMFPHLTRRKYHQITLSLSKTLSFST